MQTFFRRLLRTDSSERHTISVDGTEIAVVDLHYLSDATVQATLIIYEGANVDTDSIPDLLNAIDDVLLPEVRLDSSNLTFTVVIGRVLGAYSAEPPSSAP